MRNRWEGAANEDLDEPVSITERQLRSLKLGARAGLFALILALAATGLAGWTWFQGGKQGNPMVASTAEQARPPESRIAQAETTTPVEAPSAVAPSPAASAPAVQPATAAASTSKPAPAAVRAVKPASTAARAPKHTSTTARASQPVTESFDPSTTAPALTLASMAGRDVAPSYMPMIMAVAVMITGRSRV